VTDATIETIKFVGALVGLATGIFILIDRLLLGRPVVTITPSKHTRDLRFQNSSKHPIVLLSIHSWPRWVWIARDDTPEGIAAAAVHQIFSIVLQPWGTLNSRLSSNEASCWTPKVQRGGHS
jgi:hypothetical protein